MPRTLVITNDFPPRKGGIQTFIEQLLSQQYPRSLVVFTSNWTGAAEYDATLPYDVIRIRGKLLLPTPKRIREAKKLAKRYDCDQVLFGALAPLGLMSGSLKRFGIKNIVAITHGHEAGWAKIPLLRTLLKLSAAKVDVVTYLTQYTKEMILPLLKSETKTIQLTPAVDVTRYQPANPTLKMELKKKYHLENNLVLLGLSRLMPRKGFDSIIKLMPKLITEFPELKFVVAGGGPDKDRLIKLAKKFNVSDRVLFLGSIPYDELPQVYQMADVFAMPCRTRFFGLDVEGFGIVYLEAAATGLPVIAGNSGGAVEAVLPGITGELAERNNLEKKLRQLLQDEQLRERYGQQGRRWVETEFSLVSRGEILNQQLNQRLRD
ncbi:MAG: glycosyltransferase family 4 protein [Candidatus Nanopelagicales bacterium]